PGAAAGELRHDARVGMAATAPRTFIRAEGDRPVAAVPATAGRSAALRSDSRWYRFIRPRPSDVVPTVHHRHGSIRPNAGVARVCRRDLIDHVYFVNVM